MSKIKKILNSIINYYYKMEVLSMVMLIVIILLLTTSLLSFDNFVYFNNYIGINNILAAVLLLALYFLRDEKKINIFLLQNTLSINVLIYEAVYYLNVFGLLLLNIYTDNLNFLIGLLIFATELFLLLSVRYKQEKNEINREFLKMWQYKDIHYIVMTFFLVLQNYPFEIYAVPFATILAALYIVVNLNIIYKIYE